MTRVTTTGTTPRDRRMTDPRPEGPAPAPGAVPTRGDGVAAWLGEWLGGPSGRHAVVGWNGWARVASLLVAGGAALLALGVLTKGHCVANGWVSPDQYWRMCYSDVPVVPVAAGLTTDTGAGLFGGGTALDQPPLSGVLLRALAALAPSGSGVATQQVVFTSWAVLAVLLLAAAVVAAAWTRPGRPWQAAHLALSPVLVTAGLVSTDLLGVALTVWALWAWRADRSGLAGALFALALLTRSLPLALLLAVVLVGVRRGQGRAVGRLLIGVGVTLVVTTGPFLLLQPAVVGAWWDSWLAAGPGYGSLQLLLTLGYDAGTLLSLSAPTASAIAFAGWVAGIGVGAWVALRGWGRRPGNEVAVAAAVLLPVLLTSVSAPVQLAVWMLPLLALADVRWRDHLVWAACEILYFGAVWLYLGGTADAERGLPASWFAAATLLRWVGWGWALVQVVRAGERPPTAAVVSPRARDLDDFDARTPAG